MDKLHYVLELLIFIEISNFYLPYEHLCLYIVRYHYVPSLGQLLIQYLMYSEKPNQNQLNRLDHMNSNPVANFHL